VASIERGEEMEPVKFASHTGADGRARLSFRMPDLGDEQNPVLVIGLAAGGTEPSLRYRLKPKSAPAAPPTP
jgi:hypothetical protein